MSFPPVRQSTVARRRALFEEAAAIVDRDYASNLSLDDVARRIASSRRQLQRAFMEAGKTTFRTYLREVRMRKAGELLRSDHAPINQIARTVGYRQPAQFAKAFRRHHGQPPSSYRASK
jgi:AraC family transcriptional regulator, regulatory protein of adaptative response / methylphosphotriester-DNA alkyltransferase methyltransferase